MLIHWFAGHQQHLGLGSKGKHETKTFFISGRGSLIFIVTVSHDGWLTSKLCAGTMSKTTIHTVPNNQSSGGGLDLQSPLLGQTEHHPPKRKLKREHPNKHLLNVAWKTASTHMYNKILGFIEAIVCTRTFGSLDTQ